MPSISRRRLLGAGPLALATSLTVAAAGRPAAADANLAAKADVKLVVDETTGITVLGSPKPRAGFVTFKASTPPSGVKRLRDLTLLRMRKGVTIEKYVAHIRMAFNPDEATRKAGLHGVFTLAHAYGGAVLSATSELTFTARLKAGTHYLLDFEDAAHPEFLSRIRRLEVGSGRRTSRPPLPDDVVTIYEQDGVGRYLSPPRLRQGGHILVSNHTSQPQEMLVVAVRPGTKEADLAAYYEALKRGEKPESPYVRGPIGMAPLSPGESTIIRPGVPAGEYALASFLSDADTMRSTAWEGTWKLVRVR